MKLKAGVIFGASVVVWQLITGFAGFYKNPAMGWVFPLGATAITVGVLIWALRQTAAEGKRYAAQLGTAMVIVLIGAVIIVFGSFLFTTVLFTDYREIALDNAVGQWEAAGMTDEQIDQAMPLAEMMVTPAAGAIMGFVMTLITGFIAALIIAAIFRQK